LNRPSGRTPRVSEVAQSLDGNPSNGASALPHGYYRSEPRAEVQPHRQAYDLVGRVPRFARLVFGNSRMSSVPAKEQLWLRVAKRNRCFGSPDIPFSRPEINKAVRVAHSHFADARILSTKTSAIVPTCWRCALRWSLCGGASGGGPSDLNGLATQAAAIRDSKR
jgi:hypothetical protein